MTAHSRIRSILFALILTSCLGLAQSAARAEEILVSAAASLTDAITRIGHDFERQNPGVTVRFNFAASGTLQRQIENGAPVDVFAAAGVKEMDALARAGRIDAATRRNFTGNRLALIVPLKSGIHKWDDLATTSVRRVAISNPDSVPSGRYARETLERRRLWDAVKSKAVYGQNVRQTLAYVARGEVDAGIVFASDAAVERKRVRIAQYGVPGLDHTPIVYPAAVVARSRHAALAKRFVTFLGTQAAQSALAGAGFTSLAPVRAK